MGAPSCSETIRSNVNLNCHFKTFHVNTAFWLTVLFWLRTNGDWLPAVWLGLNKTAPAAAYRYIILLFLILWLIGVFSPSRFILYLIINYRFLMWTDISGLCWTEIGTIPEYVILTWRYYVTRAFEKILSFQPFCIEQVFNKVGMAFCPMHSRLYMMFLNSIPRLHNTPGHGVESRVHTNKELILAISGYWNWDSEEWDDYEMAFLPVIVN